MPLKIRIHHRSVTPSPKWCNRMMSRNKKKDTVEKKGGRGETGGETSGEKENLL